MPATSDAPTNLKQLIVHLGRSPDVILSRPGLPAEPRRFVSYERGGLWFSRDGEVEPSSYMPVNCGMTAAESGLEFDAAGFTITKFGVAIRVDYAGN